MHEALHTLRALADVDEPYDRFADYVDYVEIALFEHVEDITRRAGKTPVVTDRTRKRFMSPRDFAVAVSSNRNEADVLYKALRAVAPLPHTEQKTVCAMATTLRDALAPRGFLKQRDGQPVASGTIQVKTVKGRNYIYYRYWVTDPRRDKRRLKNLYIGQRSLAEALYTMPDDKRKRVEAALLNCISIDPTTHKPIADKRAIADVARDSLLQQTNIGNAVVSPMEDQNAPDGKQNEVGHTDTLPMNDLPKDLPPRWDAIAATLRGWGNDTDKSLKAWRNPDVLVMEAPGMYFLRVGDTLTQIINTSSSGKTPKWFLFWFDKKGRSQGESKPFSSRKVAMIYAKDAFK